MCLGARLTDNGNVSEGEQWLVVELTWPITTVVCCGRTESGAAGCLADREPWARCGSSRGAVPGQAVDLEIGRPG